MVTWARSRPALSDAGLLFLKLTAFVVMVLDHADWLLFGSDLGIHATLGRIVFPTFALVLAINLSRVESGRLYGIAARMAAVGLLASPAYVYLQGATVPFNVMFTLALSLLVLALWRSGLCVMAGALAGFGGLFVDYQWFGIAAVLVPMVLIQRGMSLHVAAVVVAVLLLPVNGSLWALLVLPLLYGAQQLQGRAPRLKWLFYVGYPVHLLVLALLRIAGV